MKVTREGERIILDCTYEEAEHINHVLSYTANHRICMGMCEGSLNGLYLRVKSWIKQIEKSLDQCNKDQS